MCLRIHRTTFSAEKRILEIRNEMTIDSREHINFPGLAVSAQVGHVVVLGHTHVTVCAQAIRQRQCRRQRPSRTTVGLSTQLEKSHTRGVIELGPLYCRLTHADARVRAGTEGAEGERVGPGGVLSARLDLVGVPCRRLQALELDEASVIGGSK